MGRQIIIIVLSVLTVSCYDTFHSDNSPSKDQSVVANTTIEQLHTIYSAGVREINQELIVEGTVTANDEFSNFFKCFIIESDGYSLEVLDGLYDSYVRHTIGAKVTVRLNELGLDRYLGVLRTGLVADASTSHSLDYMAAEAIVDKHIEVVGIGAEPSPRVVCIEELKAFRAGELVSLEKLKLHTEDGLERSWEGYALFRDANLDTVWCYTSPYADFAKRKIPQDIVSIQGVVEYGATDSHTNQFIIKMRNEEDCLH